MSDQNNHRRSPHTWNQLQLPSYAVRQPQLAHMLNERSLDRSLLTWHTPTLADPVYSSLAGNLQNKITEPLGSVDLTVSSISQKNVTSSNCLHLVEHTFQPDYAKNYADIETAASDNSGQKLEQSKEIISSCTENSRDAIESCLNGGLLVRDAKQINNDIIKMPSPKPLLTLLEPLELIKENKHYPKNNNGISLSSKEYTTRLYPSCSKLQAFNLKNSLNPYACNLVISKPDEDTLKHVTSEATNRLSSTQQYKINVPPLLVANKDSIGSSSSNKKRRKRKPSKTALMLNDSDNDLASTELVDLKTYQHTNIAATFNSLLKTGMLETGSFADHQSDLSTANLDNYRQRRNLLSESTLQTKNIDNIEIITKSEETSGSKNDFEDYETIDKIAAMIASTEENEVLLPQKIPNEKINDLRNSLDYDHFTEKNYEDVENKLEEMFAGIEDDRPLSNSMSQNPPSSNIKLLSFDMMYDDSTNKNSVRNTPPKSHQNIVLGGKKKKKL